MLDLVDAARAVAAVVEMADAPGNLVYQCRGSKLTGGYVALPDWIRTRVEAEHPEYQRSPDQFTQLNETTWTYFKKVAAAS